MEKLNKLLERLGLKETVNRFKTDYGSSIKKIAILGILVIVIFVAITVMNGSDGATIDDSADNKSTENTEITSPEIYIDIGGEVANPMLAKLPEGSRVEDAIQAAGGLTEDADLSNINRAEFLQDGQKVFVPALADTSQLVEAGAGSVTETANTKVNINTADSTQLQTLNGVGPATAQKIIDYRTSNGRFSKIEDLKNVSGIGDKTFEKLKNYIVA